MALRLFVASVSSSVEMKKRQERIMAVLTSKNIKFETIDIAQNSDDKDLMRKIAGDPKALPPQLCKGNTYLGDYTAFDNAIEEENLKGFLQL